MQVLVVSAVTLVIGWVVAIGLYVSADVPSRFLTDSYPRIAPLLVVLAAPAAVLVSWGELDLSVFGTAAVSAYLYAEVSDAGIFVGLALAGGFGLAVGLALGVLRWLTGTPSAMLTLGAGLLLQAVALRLLEEIRSPIDADGAISGSSLAVLAGVVLTGISVAMAVIHPGQSDAAPTPVRPMPHVILAFAASGLAAGLFGGIETGTLRSPIPPSGSVNLLLPLLTALAIGGVLRGSGFVAPVAAAAGALAARLIQALSTFHNWEPAVAFIILGAVLVVCLVVANGLDRALASPSSPTPAAIGPPPPPPPPHLAPDRPPLPPPPPHLAQGRPPPPPSPTDKLSEH